MGISYFYPTPASGVEVAKVDCIETLKGGATEHAQHLVDLFSWCIGFCRKVTKNRHFKIFSFPIQDFIRQFHDRSKVQKILPMNHLCCRRNLCRNIKFSICDFYFNCFIFSSCVCSMHDLLYVLGCEWVLALMLVAHNS